MRERTNHRSLILPAVLIGSALAAWVAAFLMADRVRVRQERWKTAALNEWEAEGGRVVAPAPGSAAGRSTRAAR